MKFSLEEFEMRKVTIIGMMILAVMLIGCSKQSTNEQKMDNLYSSISIDELKASNLYSPFSTQKTKSDYQVNGTVYLSGERALVNVQANSETEITLVGTFEKKEGEIKLLYEDANGNTTTLIDSENSDEKTINVSLSISLKEGNGKIYFLGDSCVYDFALNFSLQDSVDYFLNTNRMAKATDKEIIEVGIDIAQLEPNEWVEFGPYNFESKETWSATLNNWEGNDAIHVAYGLNREHITSDYEFNEEIKGIGVSMFRAGNYCFYVYNASDNRIENVTGKLRLYISKYPE